MADESPTDRFHLSDEEKDRRLAQVRAKLAGQLESDIAPGRSGTKVLVVAAIAALVAGLLWVFIR